jgi:SAM-dependent methyltransferase
VHVTHSIQASDRWYETAFGPLTAEFWHALADPAQTTRETDFIVSKLAAPEGAHLVDLACGDGRHAKRLVAHGFRVTGLDMSPAMLALAKHGVASGNPRFVRADMLAVQDFGPYDGAYLWGNSFGYLPHADTIEFLNRVAAALELGARFLVESGTVAECLLPRLQLESDFEANGIRFEAKRRYAVEESALHIAYRISRGDDVESFTARQAVHTSGELVRMFAAAGLALDALYADVDGTPFALGAQRWIGCFRRA